VSDDLVEQLRRSVVVDPGLLPGALVFRSGIEQRIELIGDSTRIIGESVASDLIAEDCRSVLESAAYVIRLDGAGESIICECCGTQVALMPESPVAEHDAGVRRWRPAIWEPQSGRKHTLRRCNWLREHALPATTRHPDASGV